MLLDRNESSFFLVERSVANIIIVENNIPIATTIVTNGILIAFFFLKIYIEICIHWILWSKTYDSGSIWFVDKVDKGSDSSIIDTSLNVREVGETRNDRNEDETSGWNLCNVVIVFVRDGKWIISKGGQSRRIFATFDIGIVSNSYSST